MNKKQDGRQQIDLQLHTEAKVKHADELLHELRTHQIELEMQNEELRSANAALQASRDRYLQLYDFAPVGYLTLTEDRANCRSEPDLQHTSGCGTRETDQSSFCKYLLPEDSDRWHLQCLDAKQHRGKQNCELTLRRADDTFFQARLESLYTEAPIQLR